MAFSLPREKRLAVLAGLVNGNGESAIERMTGVSRKTVRRMAVEFGESAWWLHNQIARDLACNYVEVDEIWGYVRKKQSRVLPSDPAEYGEAYAFTGLDRLSRFLITFYIGKRNAESANAFMGDLRSRLVVMPAITSDGFAPYPAAIGKAFGYGVDHAVIVKDFKKGRQKDDDYRYEPPRDPMVTKRISIGAPNLDMSSTSYVERNNGTIRTMISRMHRLSYGYSRRIENHRAAFSLFAVYYNLVHIPRTLRITPAMAVGIMDHPWELEELLDALLSAQPCEGPTAQPLGHRKPSGSARELPNGRGFLRLVPSGNEAPQAPEKNPLPAAPAIVPVAVPVAAAAPIETAPAAPTDPSLAAPAPSNAPAVDHRQLSLLDWRPKPRPMTQLNLPGWTDPSGPKPG